MTSTLNQSGQRWPTGTDYARSVQHPPSAFADERLRSSSAATNAMGIPLVASGQNAVVFLMKTGGDDVAVRCFTTPPSEGSVRYRALSEHLGHSSPTAITASKWLDDGIMVDERRWPIVTMPWVDGKPMNLAVEDAVGERQLLSVMAEGWVAMVDSLQRADVTHGDLQHGNVLVDRDGKFRLVDLDGCWVPNMRVGAPGESGHPNYQHPRRTAAQWDRFGDSFPALLIEIGLRALAVDPSLARFLNGENILFTRADLSDPTRPLWDALAASPDPEVVRLTGIAKSLASGPAYATMCRYLELRAGKTAQRPAGMIDQPPMVVVDGGSTTGGEWWAPTPAGPGPAPGPINEVPGRLSGGVRPTDVPPSGPSPTRRPEKVSIGARLGRDAVISGALGGAVAAAAGSALGGAIGRSSEEARPALLVASVAVVLGAVLLSWQAFLSGARRAGWRRLGLGALLGAAAGLLSLLPANAIYGSASNQIGITRHEGESYKLFDFSPVLSGGVWAVVAGLVGLALGAWRGVISSLAAGLGGAITGFLGGLAFGATVAEFRGHLLLVDGLDPATLLIVAGIGLVIGTAIGATGRSVSKARLTIIEGRSKGMETLLPPKRATIGSSSGNTLVLANDAAVAPRHAMIDLTGAEARVIVSTPGAAVRVNGAVVGAMAGESAPLRDGDVLAIGGSFVRFDARGSGS